MAYKNKTSHYRTDKTIDETKVEELEPCVKYTVKCWDDWDSHWSNKLSDFEDYYKRWSGEPPKRDEEWQSNFHKKLSWQAEKALVSRFHSALFPTSAPIDYDSTEDVDEISGILSKSIVAHWFKIGKFSIEFLKGIRSAAIYGTGFFEDEWLIKKEEQFNKIEREIPDYRKMVDEKGQAIIDEEGNVKFMQVGSRTALREESKKVIVEDRYNVKKANIFAWRVHPKKLTDDDNYPVIKQEFISFEDLEELEEKFKNYGITNGFENMDKLREDKFNADETDLNRHFKYGDETKSKDEKNKTIEILHYWGMYADDKGNRKPTWIMVANRKYKLRLSDNPFWHKKPPLFHIIWTEDEKPSYYGIGLVEVGKDAEDRANNVVNIRTDERKKNVKGGGWYNATDKKIKKNLLHSNVPGLYKPCSDVNNAVRPDIPIPSTPDDYKEEEISVNDHREITGATTSLLPAADEKKQHDTLGGMRLLVGQAAQRLKPDLVMMELMGIRTMANRAFLLTRQFYNETKAIKLMASKDELKRNNLSEVYRISPQDIIGKINFFCTGLSETLEKSQNIDKLLKYAEVTSKIPAMQAITNYQNIAKRIALWLGFEDVEEFVRIDPMNPLAQQPMMQPQGLPPGVQQQGLPQRPNIQGGLPPQVLQQIAQGIVQ